MLPSVNTSQTWFRIGENGNNCLVVGLISGAYQGIMVRSNAEYIDQVTVSTRVPVGQTAHIKFTYDNGVMTYSDGDETITLTNGAISPSKLLSNTMISSSVSNIKIYNI